MRKHLGIVSILILITLCFVVESFVGKPAKYEPLLFTIVIIGYLTAILACWYSVSGFWRKASATILIGIPIVYLVIIFSLIFGIQGF